MLKRVGPSNINNSIRRYQRQLDKLPREGHAEFKRITPIDTGNAKASTKLKGNVVDARYNYANRLNEGYSKQAPQGMTDPTIDFLRKRVRQILG